MDRMTYRYTFPDRFVAGTIGVPGQRTFFLQAVDGRRVTSVSLEKAQVAMLAERLGLRHGHVDEPLPQLVVGVALDPPGHRLCRIG